VKALLEHPAQLHFKGGEFVVESILSKLIPGGKAFPLLCDFSLSFSFDDVKTSSWRSSTPSSMNAVCLSMAPVSYKDLLAYQNPDFQTGATNYRSLVSAVDLDAR
jgi:hypothetical protein